VFQLKTHSKLFDVENVNADDDEREEPQMGPWPAAGVLVVVTIAVAVCAEYLVDSIDSLVATVHVSRTFVGLVLLPIVGNAAEHVTSIIVAMKVSLAYS
jgi:Ca2+:H+ antiporter